MTFWTGDKAKVKYAKEYFSSLNPMAAKIIEKRTNIEKSFSQEKWEKLSNEEKENIFNKRMINPEFERRYKDVKSSELPTHYHSVFPKLIVTTGQVLIDDEAHQESWNDEHSDPFSWETQSQMNMPLPPRSTKSKKKVKKSKAPDPHMNGKVVSEAARNGESRELQEVLKKRKEFDDSVRKTAPNDDVKQSNESHQTNQSTLPMTNGKSLLKQESVKNVSSDVTSPPKEEQAFYKLQDKSVRKRPESKRSQSSRINPRNSLTLEGAIRNLELAMLEERKVQEQNGEKPTAEPATPECRQDDVDSQSKKMESDLASTELDGLDDFLLNDTSPTMSFGFKGLDVDEDDDNVQKSGFDFLDNW